jgi:hypothetical protein
MSQNLKRSSLPMHLIVGKTDRHEDSLLADQIEWYGSS